MRDFASLRDPLLSWACVAPRSRMVICFKMMILRDRNNCRSTADASAILQNQLGGYNLLMHLVQLALHFTRGTVRHHHHRAYGALHPHHHRAYGESTTTARMVLSIRAC